MPLFRAFRHLGYSMQRFVAVWEGAAGEVRRYTEATAVKRHLVDIAFRQL